MKRARRLAVRSLLGLLAVALSMVVAELAALGWLHWIAGDDAFRKYASIDELRARYGEFERLRTHRHLGYAPAPGYRKGANRHNAFGCRGDEIERAKRPGTLRVVFCGGSTTYGEGIEDHLQTMPFLVQQRLRDEGVDVEVVNAGCPGWTTLETLINFETRLLDLAPDCAVVTHGINDVLPRLVWPHDAYRGDWSGWLCRDEPVRTASLLERSALAWIMMIARGGLEPHGSMLRIIGDVPSTSFTFGFRGQRQLGIYPAGVFREVPVERMLEVNRPVYFERNLRNLIAVAKSNGVRVVLATFAYGSDWPSQPYIGHPAIRSAIDETNSIVRRLAAAAGVSLLDIAPSLTDRELFTDGVHFTVAGERRRAELTAPVLSAVLRQ